MQTRRCTRLPGITLAVLLTLVVGQGLGFADDDGNRPPQCTLATLKGRYLFGGIATLLPPAVQEQSLLSVAGYHIFNGDGTGTDVVTASINGMIVRNNEEFDITYEVNSDCSGTYTVLADGVSFGLYVAPNGEELMVIGTGPGVVLVQGPNRRVSGK
jgi:hypothetical protein